MTTDNHPVEPPHQHDDDIPCYSWHLTVRTPAGELRAVTTRTHPDDLTLPPGWELIR